MTPIRPSVSPGLTYRAIRCWVSSPGLLPPPPFPPSPPVLVLCGKYRAVYPASMKYSCATRYTPEIPGLFGNSEARDVCIVFLSLSSLSIYLSICPSISLSLRFLFSISLPLCLCIASDERKRWLKDSPGIAKCTTAVVQHTGRGGYFNPWTREKRVNALRIDGPRKSITFYLINAKFIG